MEQLEEMKSDTAKLLRDAWNIRGVPSAQEAPDTRHSVAIAITSQLEFSLQENRSGAGTAVHLGTITGTITSAGTPGALTTTLGGASSTDFRLGAPSVSGGVWSVAVSYVGTGLDAETASRLQMDVLVRTAGTTTTQAGYALGALTIIVMDRPEAVARHQQPAAISLNSNDTTPQQLDYSTAYTDDDPSGWLLGLSPLSTTYYAITDLDTDAHTFAIAATGTAPPGASITQQLIATGTDGATGLAAAQQWSVPITIEAGAHPTTIQIGVAGRPADSEWYPSTSRPGGGRLVLYIDPDQAGNEEPISLGSYTATPTTTGTAGAITWTLEDFTLDGLTNSHYQNDLSLDKSGLSYTGASISAGSNVGFRLVAASAATADAQAGSNYLDVELRSRYQPTLAITGSPQPIEAGVDGRVSAMSIGDFTATITGLPPDISADQVPPLHWALAGSTANLFALDVDSVPGGVRGLYVGPPQTAGKGINVSLVLRAIETDQVAGSTLTQQLVVPVAVSYSWWQEHSSVYVQVSSASVSLDEGTALAPILTSAPLYLYVPDLPDRDLSDTGFTSDADEVWYVRALPASTTLTLPGLGEVAAQEIPLSADASRLDAETITQYTSQLEVSVPAATAGGITYPAVAATISLTAQVGDVDEGPVFTSGYVVPQIYGRVGGTASPIPLAGLWTDPEGRTLGHALRSSASNIVSVALDGEQGDVQYGVAGEANIEGRAYDGSIWAPWQLLAEYVISEAAPAVPTFQWASPTSSLQQQNLPESTAVGHTLLAGLYATATTDDQTATLGAISYSIQPIPADVALPPLTLPSGVLRCLWWIASEERLYFAGDLHTEIPPSNTEDILAYMPSGDRAQSADKTLALAEIADIYGSALGYGVGKPTASSTYRLYGLSHIHTATITADAGIALPSEPASVESWGDGTDERIYVALKGTRHIRAYTYQSATWAASSGDDWGPSTSLADSLTAMGSDATHVWVACKLGTTQTLRCWQKSDKNRVDTLDRALPHITDTIESVEVVGEWILLLVHATTPDSYRVEIVRKPSA